MVIAIAHRLVEESGLHPRRPHHHRPSLAKLEGSPDPVLASIATKKHVLEQNFKWMIECRPDTKNDESHAQPGIGPQREQG